MAGCATALLATSCVTAGKQDASQQKPIEYPGAIQPTAASADIDNNTCILQNNLIAAKWAVINGRLRGLSVTDIVNGKTVFLPQEIFRITFNGKEDISSLKMKMVDGPDTVSVDTDFSKPQVASHFGGEAIEAEFVSEDGSLTVFWRASLRDNANYIRTEVSLRANAQDLPLKEVVLLNTIIPGSDMVGEVQGSVMTAKTMFFAYEHPMAENTNGTGMQHVGNWTEEQFKDGQATVNFDVTDIINEATTYQPQFVAGKSKISISDVKLLAGDKVVAEDNHEGYTGKKHYWNIYNFDLKEYDSNAKYSMAVTFAAEGDVAGGVIDINRKNKKPLVHCGYKRNSVLKAGQTYGGSLVMGVFPEKQLRRAFLYYIEKERCHPYRPFLHYNSWYDIGYFNKYTEKDCLDVINGFGKELVEKRGVKMDSLLFDDGWDNDETLWLFHKEFPQGFTNVKAAAAKYGVDPGVWLSPWGGYGKPRERRIKAGSAAGFEFYEDKDNPYNSVFKMSGPKYYERFSTICKEMVTKYNVNQFKFDGIGGNSGAGAGDYAPDFEAALKLINELRDLRSDVYINLTTGTWPSPFWLQQCDSIWRGGYDHQFTGVGSKRQQWINYRDGMLYERIVARAPLYPINSLMVHGAIYAERANGLNTADDKDLRDEIHSMFGAGSQLQELYITHSLMNKQNWDDLAQAAKWARKNADVLVDTHWVGGNPVKGELYGFASWNKRQGTLTLRNPSDKPQSIVLNMKDALEIPKHAISGKYRLVCPFLQSGMKKEDWPQSIVVTKAVTAYKKLKFTLQPFEVMVFDVVDAK